MHRCLLITFWAFRTCSMVTRIFIHNPYLSAVVYGTSVVFQTCLALKDLQGNGQGTRQWRSTHNPDCWKSLACRGCSREGHFLTEEGQRSHTLGPSFELLASFRQPLTALKIQIQKCSVPTAWKPMIFYLITVLYSTTRKPLGIKYNVPFECIIRLQLWRQYASAFIFLPLSITIFSSR